MPKDLSSYYVERLASIYRSKPKASATIALLTKAVTGDGLVFDLNTAFDLEQAFGDQLDTIGKYVGAPRDVGVVDFTNFFGFVTYAYPTGTDNEHGFISYSSISLNRDAVWLKYASSGRSSSMLPDFSYRQLIKLKIVTNSSDNTTGSIQDQIELFYNRALQLRDNQNMTMTYFYSRTFQLPTTVLEQYLPRPMGVGITIVEAIGFDVRVGTQPAYTSETPHPIVDFGITNTSVIKIFSITNVTHTPFTIDSIIIDSPFVVANFSPSLPVTLNFGEELTFTVQLFTAGEPLGPISIPLEMTVFSEAGAAIYRSWMEADIIAGVTKQMFTSWFSIVQSVSPADYTTHAGDKFIDLGVLDSLEDINILSLVFSGDLDWVIGFTPPTVIHNGGYDQFAINVLTNDGGTLTIEHDGLNSPFVLYLHGVTPT